MPPNVNVNFEIDTTGGHCQRQCYVPQSEFRVKAV